MLIKRVLGNIMQKQSMLFLLCIFIKCATASGADDQDFSISEFKEAMNPKVSYFEPIFQD